MPLTEQNKTMLKWAGGIIIGVVVIIIVYYLIKALQPAENQVPQGGGQPDGQGQGKGNPLSQITSGFLGWLTGIFSSGWENTAGGGNVACDPNKKGYNIDGIKDPACGADFTNCDPNKCDPNSAGWNECGFPDMRC